MRKKNTCFIFYKSIKSQLLISRWKTFTLKSELKNVLSNSLMCGIFFRSDLFRAIYVLPSPKVIWNRNFFKKWQTGGDHFICMRKKLILDELCASKIPLEISFVA